MQITLAQAGGTFSDILNQFESLYFVNMGKKISEPIELICQNFISEFKIGELKKMVDFLVGTLVVPLESPKKNSKISLAQWLAQVLVSTAKLEAETQELLPFEEPIASVEVEVVQPPVFDILLLGEHSSSECRVSQTPPYLIDRNGDLFAKGISNSPTVTHYTEEFFREYLSSIEAVDGKRQIELYSDNLVLRKTAINRTPPHFLITEEGGVYKRVPHQSKLLRSTPIRYCQVISEYLSNVSVV